jgi:hypothetical protein
MSLIHTCELNGANPFDYLTEFLPCRGVEAKPIGVDAATPPELLRLRSHKAGRACSFKRNRCAVPLAAGGPNAGMRLMPSPIDGKLRDCHGAQGALPILRITGRIVRPHQKDATQANSMDPPQRYASDQSGRNPCSVSSQYPNGGKPWKYRRGRRKSAAHFFH